MLTPLTRGAAPQCGQRTAPPAGAGKHAELVLDVATLDRVLLEGPRLLVEELGVGTPDDVEHTESHG